MKLRFISDPGHGWLEVPRADVERSGAAISAYSYQHDRMVYLEEDCDARAYLEAIGAPEVAIVNVYQDPTPVRGYRSFSQKGVRS